MTDFSNLKIIVAGDIMLDRYWWGSVTRISPEAPVPIVRLDETSVAAGGAANVAANLAGLGIETLLFGIRGDDPEGDSLVQVLSESGISDSFVSVSNDRPTTVKTRIVAHHQHVVRLDQETTEPIDIGDSVNVLNDIDREIGRVDAVILSDYAKGFLSDELVRGVIDPARTHGKPVIVDPKTRNFARYKGASVLTPNKREACEACGIGVDSPDAVKHAGSLLMSDLELDALLITEGEHGMTLFQKNGDPKHFESTARDVFDVTGAGDTVISVFAASIAAGESFEDAAMLANEAAGIVVGRIGTTRIDSEMLGHREMHPAAESLHA